MVWRITTFLITVVNLRDWEFVVDVRFAIEVTAPYNCANRKSLYSESS